MASNDPRSEEAFLSLRGISVTIGQTRALTNINLDAKRGEMHALVGKYGEGKSTLCAVVAGEVTPDAGVIRIDGREYSGLGMTQASDMGIEKVGDRNLSFPHLNVAEDISIGRFRRYNRYWFGRKALLRDIRAWLDGLGIELDLQRTLSELPKEERLFVRILSCLYNDPKLLILDETLERIAPARMRLLLPVLRRHQAGGMVVLWATHNLESAWNLADRISIIRQGGVALNESPRLIDRRSLIYLAYADDPDFREQAKEGAVYQKTIRYTEALLRELPTAILIIDMHETIQFVNNQGRIFFVGNSIYDEPDTLEKMVGLENGKLLAAVRAAIHSDSDEKYHSMLFLATFGECLIDVQARIVRDGDDTIGVMVIIENVSERENMRRNLMLANNLSSIGLLAAGVAHEVNNPLEIIGNYISFLLRRLPEGKERAVILSVREETGRIQEIVNNLVAFSGRKSSGATHVDLHEAASELSELMVFNAKYAGIEFRCDKPDFPTIINATASEVRQMLVNLFRNSIEAMPDGGRIAMAFADLGDKLQLTVSDTGPGIPPGSINDIFLPFVSSKSDSGANQGLGLSIVHGIVEKFGGSIGVRNIPSGGCEFKLVFPVPKD